jgi:hypothetical protein
MARPLRHRTHGWVGRVFQGRYKEILVERNSYLLELCRYIFLNPVRAAMVRSVVDWPWSSYRATAEPVNIVGAFKSSAL